MGKFVLVEPYGIDSKATKAIPHEKMTQSKRWCIVNFCLLACGIWQMTINHVSGQMQDIATYEEVKDLPNHPEKYLIDVRSRDMVDTDGSIPTSINIPFTELEDALKMEDNEFKQKYGRDKPSKEAVVIFTCLGGQYAQMGADLAKSKGWGKAKPYLGSWMEWSKREGL
ncbi:rhodanese domain-containing protein CG4456 [Stomoxys calcitrans]|uniref:rhodanese domain-containing protein CG4456 n=1 Tax=Stomoxys calcitrans TaxID=35570 RepID=UPI0027E3A063|nr:rhodanese domain-containing protein CG4456 [Stomoxys calcitrans]